MIKIIERKNRHVGEKYYHNDHKGPVYALAESTLCEFHLRGSIPSVGSKIRLDDVKYEVLDVVHDMKSILGNSTDRYTKNIEITVKRVG